MSRRKPKGWLFAATSGIALAAGAAHAQTTPIPPEHYTLDARGVDLVSGTFQFSTTEVVIGQPGSSGLSYGRAWITDGWRDTSLGSLTHMGATGEVLVSVGAISETFVYDYAAEIWVSKYDNGSTWQWSSPGVVVIDRHGNRAVFDQSMGNGEDNPYGANMGLIVELTTPAGEVTKYTYQSDTPLREFGEGYLGPIYRLSAITNNFGYMLKYAYASTDPSSANWSRVTGVQGINLALDWCDPSANSCSGLTQTWPSVSYDAAVLPTTATDQSSRVTTFGYTDGILTSVRHPGATAADIAIAYNASPDLRVNTVTDTSGAWTYGYSDSGSTRTTTASGPLSQQFVVVSDQTIGRATSVTNALSQTFTYTYDSQRRMQRVTNPEGDYVELTYAGRGNVSQIRSVAKSGSGLADILTSTTYPSTCSNPVTCNKPTATTDALGNVTDYTWDSTHGGPLTLTAPAPTSGADRPQTRYAYAPQTAYYKNSSGSLIAAATPVTLPTQVSACATGTSCVGGANEVRTTIAYGSSGTANNLLPTSISQGSGASPAMAVTTMTYTPQGDVETVDGPLAGSGDNTRYRYDAARQAVGVIGPDPDGGGARLNRAQRMSYSPRGQVTLSETGTTSGYTDSDWAGFNPLVRSATVYDERGRPVIASQQSGAGTTVGVQQVSYDAAGRPDCTVVRMNPAAWGSLPVSACTATAAGSDGPDRITRATYDAAGRPLSTTTAYGLAAAATTSVTYGANGQAASLTDGNGNVSIRGYDGFNRPVTMRYPNPTGGGTSTTDYEQVGYDARSNVVSRRNRAGQTFVINRDSLSRPVSIWGPNTATDTGFQYDNLGRQTLSWFSGYVDPISKTWDSLSRLTSETGPLGAMSYQYDAAGRQTRITWPDSFYAQYDRDLYGTVTAIRENGASSGAGVLTAYAYNNLGQPTGINRGNGTATAYGYDAAGRMTALSHDMVGSGADVSFGYTWNPAGQIASRTVSNAAYVYAPTTGSTSYQNNGLNQTTSVGGTALTYDANQNTTGAFGNSYGYDAANRLTAATIGGTGHTFGYDPSGRLYSGVGGRFQYVGVQLAGEYDTSGVLTTRHVPGPGLDRPVASYFSGARVQQIADERGSVVGVADAGGSVNINRYDEYGVPSAANRFQYTGQAWMAPGVYNYRARAYAPQLGRFMQPDPIGYQAGPNMYGYVSGDPINRIDPFGLQEEPPPTTLPPVDAITRRCDGVRVNGVCFADVDWLLPMPGEQFWRVDGDIATPVDAFTPIQFVCPNGDTFGGASFNPRVFQGADRAAHSHPNWAAVTPTYGDRVIPSQLDIPLLGITPDGVWEISQIEGDFSITIIQGSFSRSEQSQMRAMERRYERDYQERLRNPGPRTTRQQVCG